MSLGLSTSKGYFSHCLGYRYLKLEKIYTQNYSHVKKNLNKQHHIFLHNSCSIFALTLSSFFSQFPVGLLCWLHLSLWPVAMEGASPSPEGHLFSSTVMDTPARHASGTNHTLSSTTDHRWSPGFRGPSLAQWLWVWDGFHTCTHQGGVPTCDFCAQNPHWDHTCHGPKHTPPPWAQPLCSAEQLLPPGNRGQSSCSSQWRKTGGGQNGGEPWKDVGTSSGSEPRSPCYELPRVWTSGWDAHRRLHADSPSALSITDCEGPTTCSPVLWSTDLPARLRHLLIDRVVAPGRDWSVILRKLSFPQSLWQKILV